MPNNTCEHCGRSQLISGLTVSASGGGGDVRPGLLCKEKEKGFFKRSEREKRVSLFSLSDRLKKPFSFSLQRRPGRTSPPPPEAETVRPLMSCERPQCSHVLLGMDNYSP